MDRTRSEPARDERHSDRAKMASLVKTSPRYGDIVRTAAKLFDDRGYHDVGMQDIADAVGLRKPSLYHYVRSKAELLVLIHDDFLMEVLDRLEGYVADNIDPREALRHVMTDIINIYESKPGYLRVFFEHHREIPEPLRSELVRHRDRYQFLVESIIRNGINQGMFRPGLDPKLAALAMFGLTNWSYQWYRPGGPMSGSEIANFLHSIFIGGISST